MPREFLSCDWGTSSFRLRRIADGEIVREYVDKTGCKTVHEEALKTGEPRAILYERFLRRVLSHWPPSAEPLSLVISGMASSSIGWVELPYTSTPLKLNASNLCYQSVSWQKPGWVSDTFLISGAASKNDIMRGEETEAIGLLDETSASSASTLILPGTHSKHLFIEDGEIKNFCTYMTGELFEVLTRHSILKATVDCSTMFAPSAADLRDFEGGVRQAENAGLEASLFQVRARAVLGSIPSTQNAWFLSGLLIGAELLDLIRRFPKRKILLGGAQPLRGLYSNGLKTLDVWSCEPFEDRIIDRAIPRAHALLLTQICGAR